MLWVSKMTSQPRRTEMAVGAFCAVLTLALARVDLPLWLVVALPLVAYAGLSLMILLDRTQSHGSRPCSPHSPSSDRAAYDLCLRRWQDIQSLAARIDDPPLREPLRHITGRIDLILRAMTEDNAYRASLSLLGVLNPTRDLLFSYVRVAERKLGTAEVRARVLANLVTLNAAYASFWERLNRADIAGLAAINDTIDFYLDGPDATMRLEDGRENTRA